MGVGWGQWARDKKNLRKTAWVGRRDGRVKKPEQNKIGRSVFRTCVDKIIITPLFLLCL